MQTFLAMGGYADVYKRQALAYAKEKNIIPRNCSQVSEAR